MLKLTVPDDAEGQPYLQTYKGEKGYKGAPGRTLLHLIRGRTYRMSFVAGSEDGEGRMKVMLRNSRSMDPIYDSYEADGGWIDIGIEPRTHTRLYTHNAENEPSLQFTLETLRFVSTLDHTDPTFGCGYGKPTETAFDQGELNRLANASVRADMTTVAQGVFHRFVHQVDVTWWRYRIEYCAVGWAHPGDRRPRSPSNRWESENAARSNVIAGTLPSGGSRARYEPWGGRVKSLRFIHLFLVVFERCLGSGYAKISVPFSILSAGLARVEGTTRPATIIPTHTPFGRACDVPVGRHVERDRNTRAWLRAVSRCQDATHGMIRPRPAAGMVVAFTLGRIWFCAVGCSWPVVAPLGQAQRKRKICRNTVVIRCKLAARSKRNCT